MGSMLKQLNDTPARRAGRTSFALLLLPALLAAAHCKTYTMEAPEDFVVFDRADDFKAISADGVRIIAREIPNRPRGDLDLWTRAILLQLDGQGYQIAKNEAIRTATGREGRLIESTYLLRNVKYSYWTAIFVKEDVILLVESVAPAEDLAKRESSLRKALRDIKL